MLAGRKNIQMSVVETENVLLRCLSPAVREAVLAEAQLIFLDLREIIVEPKKPILHVDFPEKGVMSLLKPMEDGSLVEIATIGNEGMIGIALVMDVPAMDELAFCQVEGSSLRIPAEAFCKLLKEYPELKSICLRYSMVLADQIARNMGCNRTHNVEERSARWLLMTQDRCRSDQFSLTQEFLSAMLGVSRTGVNLAAGILSKAGFISYVRGKISILDRVGLESVACPCYLLGREYQAHIMDHHSHS